MKIKLIIACLFQFVFLTLATAQENPGWKQFLFHENANYYAICQEVERYFEQEVPAADTGRPGFEAEDEGSAYNEFMRWKWFWSSRINADGSFPDIRPTARLRVDVDNIRHRAADRGDGESCGWQLISQNTCTGGYNGMGRSTSIAFDPVNPDIYYVGSPNGGVWKTTDGGDSYTPISEGLPYNGASNILVDYSNPDILYLSNGDHSGWWTYSTGIFKSTDGGANWFPTGLSWSLSQGVALLNAAIDPQNPAVLIVAASNGLWRTADGGASWTKVRDGFYSDVKFRPGDGSTVYAALHDYWGVSQIFRSTDGGMSWSQISAFAANHNWIRLTVTPADPNLLAAVCTYDSKKDFYFSSANGDGLSLRSNCPQSDVLIFSPTNPNVLYCGALDAYQSTDQGATWNQISLWYGGGPEPEVHADQRNVAYQETTGRIFFCNDGGIYRYDETTNTWLERTNGLIITQFYRIAVSQTDEIFTIGGTQDNGGRKRVGPGEWEATNGGDAMEVAIDYTNPDILYTTYVNGQLYRSMDGWVHDTYNRISDNLPGQTPNHDLSGSWVSPYQIDPLNPQALVLGYADVYRTTNRGGTWTKISSNLTGSADEKLDALAIAPSDPKVIFTSNNNQLYRTVNQGANWSTLTVPGSAPITSITVHPKAPNIVYITRGAYNSGSKVFRSDNGGGAWTNISGTLPNVPTNCLYLDVLADSSYHLFVGNDLGVYYRSSNMADWRGMNQNLPVTIVSDLELQQSSRRLRAGTYGRGIWEYDLNHLPANNFAICSNESRAQICLPQTYTTTIAANAWQDLSGAIELSVSPLPANATANFSQTSLTPGSSANLSIDLPAGLAEGVLPITVYGISGGDTARTMINLTLVSNDFSALALSTPADGASGVSRWPLLRWTGVPDANRYEMELATSPAFDTASLVKTYTKISADTLQWTQGLSEGQVYYWRIRPANKCGLGEWTRPFAFATASKSCTSKAASDLPKPISANGTPTVESSIAIPTNSPISELKVKNFQGNHQFFKDLEVSLLGPSGTEVLLFKNKCGSYSGNFKLGFDDNAPQAFGCPPPQNGNSYRPEGQLSAFTGQNSGGVWTLRVKDTQISAGGQLQGFELEFCSTEALNPPLIVQNQPLPILPGHNAQITANLLKAEDADTPDPQLVFTLVAAPQFGELQRNWGGPLQPGDQFTQADLNNGVLRYFDYGISNSGDWFHFAVTDGDGGLASGVFSIQQAPTSAEEPVNALAFSLAPNPARATLQLSVSAPLSSDAHIRLLGLMGQLLRSWTLPAGSSTIHLPISDLPKGIYVLTLQNGKSAGVKRVSKM